MSQSAFGQLRIPTSMVTLWVNIVLLVALATLPFLPALPGDFIQDDIAIIKENPTIREVKNIPLLFTQTYWHGTARSDAYRPITTASFAIDKVIWGGDFSGAPDPWGIHATNIILHVVASLLVFLVLQGYLSKSTAWLGAAIFAVHPVHSEAVAHLIGRSDLLMTVFFLGGWLAYRSTVHRRTNTTLAAVLYLLSMLSKEMGVVLPLVLVLDAWMGARPGQNPNVLWKSITALWPFLISLLVFFALRGWVIGQTLTPPTVFALSAPSQYLSFVEPARGEVFLTMIHAFGVYLRLCFFPVWLSADYSGFPHALRITLPVFISGLTITALFCSAWWAYRKHLRLPLYWFIWFCITMLPVSNVFIISGIIVAERVLYLPSIAACAIIGMTVRWLPFKKIYRAIGCGLILILSLLTYQRTFIWRDGLTLFQTTVDDNRFIGSIAYSGLVREYINRLDQQPNLLPQAIDYARKSVAMTTESVNVAQLAELLERNHNYEESFRWWVGLWNALPHETKYYDRTVSVMKKLYHHLNQEGDALKKKKLIDLGIQYSTQMKKNDDLQFWENAQSAE